MLLFLPICELWVHVRGRESDYTDGPDSVPRIVRAQLVHCHVGSQLHRSHIYFVLTVSVGVVWATHEQGRTLIAEDPVGHKRGVVQSGKLLMCATLRIVAHLGCAVFRRRHVEHDFAADQGPAWLGTGKLAVAGLTHTHKLLHIDHFHS